MKTIFLTLGLFAGLIGSAQTECNTTVTDSSDEMNVLFINGSLGQKTAIDIPISPTESISITHIKVTLASEEVPEYIHFRFYNSIYNQPSDPEDAPILIPGEVLFDYTSTTVGEFEVLDFDANHMHYERNIHVNLAEPIVLNGNQVQGRYWMSVLSDAPGWSTTATGGTVVGEFVASGSDNFEWFQYIGLEHLYEITAECGLLGSSDVEIPNLGLYPNPVNDIININLSKDITISTTQIYNLTGQKVYEFTGDSRSIQANIFPQGIYILKLIANDNIVYSCRFIKN